MTGTYGGRTVVVTGAAGGLGRAFALAFAGEGAAVVVADVNGAGCDETAELVRESGGRALAVTVDVTSRESTDALVAAAVAEFGGIHVLVNNAAIYATLHRAPFPELDPDEWDRVMAVNVKGAWLCSASALPHLARPGGRIINIASATVFSGSPQWMHYVASKGAVIAMTRVMAREVGADGITVNAIAPGFTLTDASVSMIDDAASYGVSSRAIPRASHPDDITGTALFLGSDAAAYLTGQTLVVDGGKQFI